MPDRGLITDPSVTPITDTSGAIYVGNGIWYTPPPVSTGIIPNQSGFGSAIGVTPRTTLALATPTQQRQDNVSAVNEPCRVVLGQDRIGAQLLTAIMTIPLVGDLLIVAVWCRGPITSINNVTINNIAIPSTVLATHYLGTASQTVDPTLVSAFSRVGFTHTYAFPGIAYSVFEFPVGATIGEINAVINGVQPYDPRNVAHVLADPTTWTYSNNPALLLAHVISNTSYGMGGTVDWSGSTAAFNACDAVVTSEVKRTIGYTMDKRLDSSSVCDILRAHAGCFVVRSAGKFRLIPDAAASSTATVSKATTTLIDKSVKWQLAGLMQQPNVVEVAWTDTSVVPWRSAVAVVPANAVPPTGEDLRLTRIDLPGCQRYSQAMREAVERRNHGRLEPLTITIDTYAESLAIEPGDVYTLDDAGAFTGTLLRLLTRSMGRKGRFTLTGKKYDPATYSSAADATPTYANTNLPDPFGIPPAVTSLVLTEVAATSDSITSPLSRINAAWTASTWPYVAGYLVTIIDDSSSATVIFPPTLQQGNNFVSPPLPSPKTYKVKVKVMSTTNVLSAENMAAITLLLASQTTQVMASVPIPTTGWSVQGGAVQTAGTAKFSSANYGVAPSTNTTVVASGGTYTHERFFYYLRLDLGQTISGDLTLPSVVASTRANPNVFQVLIIGYDENNNLVDGRVCNGFITLAACRYISIEFLVNSTSTVDGSGNTTYVTPKWQIDMTGDAFVFTMPVTTENVSVTSSASASVTAPLANRYLKVTGIQATAQSVTQANPSYSVPVIGAFSPNSVNVDCYDATNARVVKPCSVTVFGVRGDKTRTDWARDVNGATAVASSSAAGFPASAAIKGDVSNWGSGVNGWNSAGALPANLEVDFVGSKAITEIVVITLRDAYTTPNVPTVFDTFTAYGITSFTVEYWTGSAWAVVSGGTVTGNNNVMRRFPVAITTTKVRVNVTASVDGAARILSLQAIGPA